LSDILQADPKNWKKILLQISGGEVRHKIYLLMFHTPKAICHGWIPQRYINKNRVCHGYLDNEVSCQQLFCHICPAILAIYYTLYGTNATKEQIFGFTPSHESRNLKLPLLLFMYLCDEYMTIGCTFRVSFWCLETKKMAKTFKCGKRKN